MQMSGIGPNMVQCQSMIAAQHNKEPVKQSYNKVNQPSQQTNSLNQNNNVNGKAIDIRI